MPRWFDNQGITFVEVMAATVILGLLAAALQNATQYILTTEEEAMAARIEHELALSLLEEVAATAFDDPDTGNTTLGLDEGEWPDEGAIPAFAVVDLPDLPEVAVDRIGKPTETATEKTRAFFDDVDDYVIWDGSYPLQHKHGTAMGLAGYTRKVKVVYVAAANYGVTSLVPTDQKLITVQVLKDGDVVEELSTVRVQGGRHVDSAS